MSDKLKMTYTGFMDFIKRKKTISIGFIVLFFVVALLSMFVSPQVYQWNIHEGDIALKDIYAPYDFTYYWEINEDATEKKKNNMAISTPYWLQRNRPLEDEIKRELDDFFVILDVEKNREISLEDKIEDINNTAEIKLPDRDIWTLLEYPDPRGLGKIALEIMEDVLFTGYIGKDDELYLAGKSVDRVVVYDEKTGVSTERSREDLFAVDDLKDMIEERVAAKFPVDRKIRKAMADVVTGYIKSNLEIDEKKTSEVREIVVKEVKPVYHIWQAKKNELIVEKGKRVNALHIAQIAQIRSVLKPGTTPTFFLGVLLLFLLLGLIGVIYMTFTKGKDFLDNTKETGIVLINMLLIILVADVIMKSPLPSYFIPLAGMGMMITLLVSFNAAFMSVVLVSILLSVLVSGKIEVMLVLMVGSVVSMYAVKEARRRANILWAGFLGGMAKFLSISCIGLINGMGMDFYINEGVWGLISGLVAGFIVMGLLPVFEHVFKVPTNISLLELSDLNHPLLKKLALEAPGTYHHSIMVGNLAESACDAIGANSLLARVGSYYHDIGKIPKAEYFSENEMGAGSRHDNLAPSMSALIIAKHVKEGAEIAGKYKLNRKIIDFITQHHGNSLISYFYQRAIEKSEQGEEPKEENFRYPGPRPQTKESAIILLSDSVEASSRTLDDPTPASIKNLVRKIVNNKFIDGQLDECDLTLRDMHDIVDSFVRILMGIFHTRLDYPEDSRARNNGTISNGIKNKLRKQKPKEKD